MLLLVFPHRFIANEDEYKKFARSYHRTVIIALGLLLLLFVIRYKHQEVEEDSYSCATRCLTDMMGRLYIMALGVSAFFWAIGSHHRVFEEVAMLSGFSTVMLFSLYVLGVLGVLFMFLPVYPSLRAPPLRAAYFWPYIQFV